MCVIDERVILVSIRACGGWHHTKKGRGKGGGLALCVNVVGEGGREGGRGERGEEGVLNFFGVCEER